MGNLREPILAIAVGQKGVGKTFTTTAMISDYIQSNPTTGKKGRKVLIYDVNMEYTQFKTIHLKDVPKFTMQKAIEVRRVLPRLDDGSIASIDEMMVIMNKILSKYAGGMLILEDINRYLIGTQTQDIIGTIATNRHRDLDIMIHLQSLAAVTPRLFQNCGVIRFHKQQDNIVRYKSRIPYYELLKIAENIVEAQYYSNNERFYCYVSGEEGYIRGNFTKEDMRNACETFVLNNSIELRSREKSYKGKHDPRTRAIKELTDELMKKYYR